MMMPVDRAMPGKIAVYRYTERFSVKYWIWRRNEGMRHEPIDPYIEIEKYFSGERSFYK